MTTFSDWFRFVILPSIGGIAFISLVVATVELFRDLRRKRRAYGGWNW